MRAAQTIAIRELAAAFQRPLAYVVLGTFVGLVALLTLWFDDVLLGGVASMRRPFRWMASCLLFLIPATTMGLVAEERRAGTWLILGSLPVHPSALVVGKWLSAVGILAFALLLTLPWPVLLAVYGEPDWGPIAGGYLGLFLGGSALAAVGTASSVGADSQVVAFLVAFVACLVPFSIGYALPLVPASWVGLVQLFTFEHHFSNLARGILDTRSVIFFVSIIAVALRVAVHLLEGQRLS